AAEEALARVAELALAFGATVSYSTKEDAVWADVTGCAHLHDARNLDRGEKILAGKLAERVRLQGHDAAVAIADGPRIALAFARFAPSTAGKNQGTRSLVIARDATKQAVSRLPIAALPVDDAAKHWLDKLGLKSAADLARLPRDSLGARLGAQSRSLFSFLEGADVEPLDAYRPPQTPMERVELEYGIEGGEALLFVVKMLSARMAVRLEGRALGATELELTFELDDAARNRAKNKRSRVVRAVTLAAPIRSEPDLMAVLRTRIEAAERRRETFEAPILAVELAVTKLARMESRELDLLSRETSGARAFPLLVAELSADLGKEQVGLLALQNTHRDPERARLVPVGEKRKEQIATEHDGAEPARFLKTAIAAEKVILSEKTRLIRRAAWIEWWKERGAQQSQTHDVLTAWATELGVTAWIDVDLSTGQKLIRGWE
ncbi:MAG: DNA polymerase Y family protein, partial [Polyangiaceae bacterium]